MPLARRYPLSFYLAVAANFFFFAGFQWTYVTLPGYIQRIGGDATQIGLAYGLTTLSAVAVRLPLGRIVDAWGRKLVLLAGAAIFTLVPVCYTLTTSLLPFMAVQLLRGLGLAAFTTAYTALVADLAPPVRRGEAIGLSGVTNNVGMLFAPALGAIVQARSGYTIHFWVAACITAASLVALLPIAEPAQAKSALQDGPGLSTVARLRPVWVATLASTGLAVAYGAALSFLAPFAEERGLTAAGGYFSAFALATMAVQAAAGWLSDRIGRRAVALPGLLVTAGAMVGLTRAHTDVALLAAGAGLGLSWGLLRAGLDAAVVDSVSPDSCGKALAVLYTCFDAGIGVGSFGLGVVAQAGGYAAAFSTAAIWTMIAVAGFLVWGRRRL
jgi:MFS family permease